MKVLMLIIGALLSSSALACNNGATKSNTYNKGFDSFGRICTKAGICGDAYEQLKRLGKASNACTKNSLKHVRLSEIPSEIMNDTPQDVGVKFRKKKTKISAMSTMGTNW